MSVHKRLYVGSADRGYEEMTGAESVMTAEEAAELVASGDSRFPAYVERHSQKRILIMTPLLSAVTEFVGPVADLCVIHKALKHRRKPEPKPGHSETYIAAALLEHH